VENVAKAVRNMVPESKAFSGKRSLIGLPRFYRATRPIDSFGNTVAKAQPVMYSPPLNKCNSGSPLNQPGMVQLPFKKTHAL
jgi:hypothetical protein